MSTRRTFLRQSSLAAAAAALPAWSFSILRRPAEETIIGQGDFRYRVRKDWAKISQVHTPLLNCHEMVMDSRGRLLMLGDNVRNNVLVFDKSGRLLDAWGTQYPGGHGLTLSKEGEEDFLFIVDCGFYLGRSGEWERQAGQVLKTTLDGRVVFSLGHPHTLGIYRPEEAFQPTEVAVAPNGDFYVADGYGSDYILHYSHRGEFVRKFGGKNNANPAENLDNAHGVAVDTRDPARPLLVVTSRNDYSFKYFTLDGKYLHTVELPGAFVCRPVFAGENLYAGVCWSVTPSGERWAANTGFVTILDRQNRVVSNPGGRAPEYVGGKLQPLRQGEDRTFQHGHDVCVDDEGNLYVCQWNASHTPPVKLERV
jgi:hypothetical protein